MQTAAPQIIHAVSQRNRIEIGLMLGPLSDGSASRSGGALQTTTAARSTGENSRCDRDGDHRGDYYSKPRGVSKLGGRQGAQNPQRQVGRRAEVVLVAEPLTRC